MENQTITKEEFYVELLSAVNVCFEGKAERKNGEIIYVAPNGQQFRISAESIA